LAAQGDYAVDTKKLIARKVMAFIAIVSIAAAVLVLAPPATRLVIALLALPIEMLIVASLFSDSRRQIPQHYPASRAMQ
jgi:uncharacterized membrane protein HdeD (DUF308 family)